VLTCGSSASSIPTGRSCRLMMDGSSRTSLSKRCAVRILPCMAKESRHVRSAMLMIW